MTTDVVLQRDSDAWSLFQNPYKLFLDREVGFDETFSFWGAQYNSYGIKWVGEGASLRIAPDHKPRDWRRWLAIKYSWAIPNERAIRTIASYGPVVEMGAGTGYWSWLLQQVGCDVVAYDANPPQSIEPWDAHEDMRISTDFDIEWHAGQRPFIDVKQGYPLDLLKHRDRTLFLCWPLYDHPFARNCLDHYRGNTLAYVGESHGGCTGGDDFHETLARDWDELENYRIPQWSGIHDELFIYRRKQPWTSLTKRALP